MVYDGLVYVLFVICICYDICTACKQKHANSCIYLSKVARGDSTAFNDHFSTETGQSSADAVTE